MRRTVAALGVVALVLGACGDDDGPAATTTTAAVVEPTDATATTSAPTTVPPTTAAPTTSAAEPGPGDPCEPGSVDCVEDAWGDGVARLIVGYDECAEQLGENGLCSDLDQDGYAGYPDSG